MTVQTNIYLDGKDLHVKTSQDVEDIIENNKRLQSEPQKHFAPDEPDDPVVARWLSPFLGDFLWTKHD